ncbi:MAG TPA: gamma-glutamyltransferase family protein [Planctomycetota bacterium]|nr:gamma-glutamyltransferase family protein [Planctomycetota bacterium]
MRPSRREFLAGAAALPFAAGCGGSAPPGAAVTAGMAATSQKFASHAAVLILREGGNAADAAVAAAAMLGLTEPMSTGLGGDMFALFYDAKTRMVSGLNGSGRAPAALSVDLLRRQGLLPLPPHHAHAVTVPGACAGWFDLIARHGSLPMTTLLAPAIRTAEEGYPVAEWSGRGWAGGWHLLKGPGAEGLLKDSRAPKPGETFRNPALARVLRTIAGGGKDAYYKGDIGRAVAAAVRSEGGLMTTEDLAAHESTWVEPLSTTYRGLRVWECPPNGQGITALLALNILEGFDLKGQDPLGPERWHLLIEAMRIAFADARWYVADPEIVKVPAAELLSKDYAARRRALLNLGRATVDVRRGSPAAGSDTVYFCVVDGAGNACSFINSNYMGFGTGIVPEGCGFSLQNRGACFVNEPGHPNCLEPRKRPYHTIIPGMLTRSDGTLYGPFGVMGGFMQPQGHVQVVVGLVDDGLEPQAVVDRPRFCVQPVEGAESRVHLEAGLPPATVSALKTLGHPVLPGVSGYDRAIFGRGQVIRRDAGGKLTGGSDPRADGGVQSL